MSVLAEDSTLPQHAVYIRLFVVFLKPKRKDETKGLGSVSGLERYIRPYRNGQDIAGISRNSMVIDLFGLTSEEVKMTWGVRGQGFSDISSTIFIYQKDDTPRM